MSREIKFRAYDRHTNSRVTDSMCYYMSVADDGSLSVMNNIIVCQFTGLHDKNGKEIYEGDICKVNYYELGLVNGVVKFRVFYSGYYLEGKQFQESMSSWEPDYIEIIGNIYENPELLK